MDKERLLSVCIITYNQEKYIEQAIESILMQKTDFTFQIIISDDCSTDETPDIIKKYSEIYPDKIKAFFQEKNLGPEKNYLFCFSQAKTKYVVINDGDDYFLSPDKLQKQVDFLENNPEYTICFHPVKKIYEDTGKTEYFPTFKMIRKGLNFNKKLGFLKYVDERNLVNEIEYYIGLFGKINLADFLSYAEGVDSITNRVKDVVSNVTLEELDEDTFMDYLNILNQILMKENINEIREKINKSTDINEQIENINKQIDLAKKIIDKKKEV